jgi:hypothetical protein
VEAIVVIFALVQPPAVVGQLVPGSDVVVDVSLRSRDEPSRQ